MGCIKNWSDGCTVKNMQVLSLGYDCGWFIIWSLNSCPVSWNKTVIDRPRIVLYYTRFTYVYPPKNFDESAKVCPII